MYFIKLFFIAFVTFPIAVFSHGPTRQKVTESTLIQTNSDKVWEIVSDLGKIGNWHSEYKSIVGNEDLKNIEFFNSGKGKIEILSINSNSKSFKYRLKIPGNIPVNNYSARLSIQENGNASKVVLKGAFYRKYVNNDPPPGEDDEAAIKAVENIYKGTLLKLKSLAESK